MLEEAIDMAIEDLPKNFKILEFILSNRAEVKDMCLFEYDEKKAMEAERAEGRAEGEAKERENTIKIMLNMVKDNILSIEEVAKRLGINVKELKEKLKILSEK